MPKINFFKKLLFLILILIICFFIFEMFYRVFNFPQYAYVSPIYFYNENIKMITLEPNINGSLQTNDVSIKISTNSHGMRDLERDYDKPNDTKRIALVGDSFVFGHVDFNDTFGKQLQNCYNDKEIEVLSFGISGYTPNDYYNYIIREVVDYSPDIVITFLYVGNDIVNLSQEDKSVVYNGYLVSNGSMNSTFVKQKFNLVLFLRKNIKCHAFFYELIYGKETKESTIKDYLRAYSNNSQTNYNIKQVEYKIKEIDDFLKKRDINHFIVIIPQKIQFLSDEEFDKRYVSYLRKKGNFTEVDYDLLYPQNKLKKYFKENEILFLDTYPSLNENSSLFYYKHDTHLNDKGNELTVRLIVRFISQEYNSLLNGQ